MDLPQEFLSRMKALLSEEYEDFLRACDAPRCYGLRVNTLKISPEEFCRIAPFHLKPIPWIPNGFFYEKEDAPARHPFYYAGLYYLQEPSAMTPARLLPVTPGERVLDLCAAPGGKATALAARLQGKGLLVANEISAARAKALLKNLEVSGVTNAFVTNTNAANLAAYFPEAFDRILVDAPCSGEGMFRKDPASARAWSLDKVRACAKTQKELLLCAASMLRPGGLLLYSTCTFSPEEDEQAAAYLLARCPELELLPMPEYEGFACGRPELAAEDWMERGANLKQPDREAGTAVHRTEQELSGEENHAAGRAGAESERAAARRESLRLCVRIFPHRMDGEGHFLALFRKKASPAEAGGKKRTHPAPVRSAERRSDGSRRGASAAEHTEVLLAFLKDVSLPGCTQEQLRQGLQIYGDKAYYVPEDPGVRGGVPFLRSGLYLGEIRKGRFEPSQALAMALCGRGYVSVLDFPADDARVLRYLRGETLEAGDLSCARQGGWQLVCVSGFPLGWGRLVNGTLKNKYHSGWRMQS